MRKITIYFCSVLCGIFTSVNVLALTSDSVKSVLERATGNKLEHLQLSVVESDEATDWFQVQAEKGVAKVEANSLPGLAYGAYQYLRDIGAFSQSWEGSRVAIPQYFPNYQIPKTHSLVRDRVYLNVCAYGYTTVWWEWEQWQQQIDWMALHGVNMPVAMEGQEYVWKKLWQEFGVEKSSIDNYFSGPAFAPWQRMGNIEAFAGPVTDNWILKKKDLQVKILDRMRSLGMKPITPAFGGYVPSTLKNQFPNAKIIEMKPWTGFEQPTYWLDPKDPLFKKIAKRFIELYGDTYGNSEYYLSDSFNEMLPPVSEKNRYADLSSYGKDIYESITQVVPEATWVMQGWMFGADHEFWDSQSIAAFLSKIPNNKVMIHDIGNDRYAVWQGANAFFGKPWTLGFIHNYGGSNPVYGNFEFYDKAFIDAYHSADKGALLGFGAFPEGINNNSVVYEYLFDVPWSNHHNKDFSQWIESYARARYGNSSKALVETWGLLNKAVFSTQYWQSRWWNGSAGAYVFFKRPQLELAEFGQHPSDEQALKKAIAQLLELQPQFNNSELYLYDVIDFVRHYATLRIDAMLQKTLTAYKAGDRRKAKALIKRIKKASILIDDLLGGQQESLATWVDAAAAYGETAEESAHYVRNARQQITIWGGPKLKDYASKAWQGMYKDFYLQRWLALFSMLEKNTKSKIPFDQEVFNKKIIQWERDWIEQTATPTHSKPKKPLKIINRIMALVAE